MKIGKILFVVTSHDELGDTGKKTGLWIEEFAAPYYTFHDLGKEIVIASPKGGQAPIDPKSDLPENRTEATIRYYSDKETQNKLSNTVTLSSVSESDFDTIFYPGGHGPMWDLPDNKDSIRLIESFYNNGKLVTLVCHAPVALKNVKSPNGEWLIKGKRVAAFTNSEEEAVQLTKVVPFLLEDMLKERGANFQKGEDWLPFVTRDGLLITGQNPASSVLAAHTVLEYAARS
ncbi:type 1 glutamine amidotransferase domain-containing protein [Chitinophaga filiformis]|uniref:Type 1 glutamine amidotransferase domain-containing protein n=1 Tax=Chitinophaga filiformis TaxID=104663 RepID=A0ABY4ICD5_CHIFI|nr:type 1 glutamine amidotransferase domain-containing protein [Chitinophaga filiformis]UPK72446.1 type 1 glutamine amidotransferase domain-containing protein [Chitinophaga filiformis]